MQKLTHWSCMEGTPACIPHRTDPGRLFFRKIFFQMFIVWNIFSSPKNQATLYFLKYQSLEKVTCGHGMSHLLPVKPLSQMHLPGRTNWTMKSGKIVIKYIMSPLPLSGWQVPYSQSQVSRHFRPQLDFEHREEQFTPCQPWLNNPSKGYHRCHDKDHQHFNQQQRAKASPLPTWLHWHFPVTGSHPCELVNEQEHW